MSTKIEVRVPHDEPSVVQLRLTDDKGTDVSIRLTPDEARHGAKLLAGAAVAIEEPEFVAPTSTPTSIDRVVERSASHLTAPTAQVRETGGAS